MLTVTKAKIADIAKTSGDPLLKAHLECVLQSGNLNWYAEEELIPIQSVIGMLNVCNSCKVISYLEGYEGICRELACWCAEQCLEAVPYPKGSEVIAAAKTTPEGPEWDKLRVEYATSPEVFEWVSSSPVESDPPLPLDCCKEAVLRALSQPPSAALLGAIDSAHYCAGVVSMEGTQDHGKFNQGTTAFYAKLLDKFEKMVS